MAKARAANANDKIQEKSGVDVNALRFNIPKGDTVEYKIVAAKQDPSGAYWTIAAQVTKDDVDIDQCVVKGWKPSQGDTGAFTHALSGEIICRKA